MLCFFSSIFLSNIDSFFVSTFTKLITLNKFRDLVYRIFKFEFYSFVIGKAFYVFASELLAIGIPILGLKNDKVEDIIAEIDPNKTSVIIKGNEYFLCF